ncbi:hypothetical protein SBA4_6060004 [Candidatus Sulfopaludibacter sp. SbA4]|nr:hypothetical protein SBA4_6060004 [Candidatus Sulfopaludibacter sp. SbA4]
MGQAILPAAAFRRLLEFLFFLPPVGRFSQSLWDRLASDWQPAPGRALSLPGDPFQTKNARQGIISGRSRHGNPAEVSDPGSRLPGGVLPSGVQPRRRGGHLPRPCRAAAAGDTGGL